jgi:2-dehydropantoate 2-reductase
MTARILVVGVGGIGGVLCARLARAGADVTPVTGNPAISAALARNGLRTIELDGSRWGVASPQPPRVELAAGDGPFDLCILATKATTLPAALAGARPHLSDAASVVVIQNGLPEDAAAAVVGAERVVGCVVGWGASMVEPGLYQRTSRGGLTLSRAGLAADLLGQVEDVTVAANFAGVRWSKLALNCATSTLGAIAGDRLGAVLRRRYIRRLVLEIWTEVTAVAAAEGVTLEPVGGTIDISRLALTERERRAALGSPALAWKHSLLMAVGVRYRKMRSSMLYALERGRVPEIDFLNGEVARRGAALGVPTPVNARLTRAVHDIVAGRAVSSHEHLRAVFDELYGRAAHRAA